jgi:hypothetical protein
VACVAASAGPTTLAAIAPATQVQRIHSMTTIGFQPHVMIVMHDTTERLLLERMCQLEGCAVRTSETGLEALRVIAASEKTYALCLIDTVLPDIEPHSLCSQILELVRGGAGCKLRVYVFFHWLMSIRHDLCVLNSCCDSSTVNVTLSLFTATCAAPYIAVRLRPRRTGSEPSRSS